MKQNKIRGKIKQNNQICGTVGKTQVNLEVISSMIYPITRHAKLPCDFKTESLGEHNHIAEHIKYNI